MMDLPETVEKYSQSRLFTEDTTPPNFQKDHATRPGVWGRLVMESGALIFAWADGEMAPLAKGDVMVIPPEVRHRVVLEGPVRFFVEFYR